MQPITMSKTVLNWVNLRYNCRVDGGALAVSFVACDIDNLTEDSSAAVTKSPFSTLWRLHG